MKKRVLATIVGAALVIACFAGCGGNNAAATSSKKEEVKSEVKEAVSEKKEEVKEEAKEVVKEAVSEAVEEVVEEATTGCPADYTIGYYMDAADDYYKAGFEVFSALCKEDPDTAGWKISDKVGQGTTQEQLDAVQDFITAGVDAIIVVQNSPEATSQCIESANAAGIPYFAATHVPSVPAGGELAGFSGYDFVEAGIYAGEDALAHGVKKVINIEGKLGQGSAAAQSLGFLQAYEDAGKDIGGTAEQVATDKTEGGKDLQIVLWASGEWWADPAKKVMTDAITSLGPDGFDGIYVQNDEMADGVLQAMEEAGLDPSNYWIGSSNGKEKSWKWVEDGKLTMDVNQTPTLEADLMFQMVKANACGEEYRQYVNPSLIPYNTEDVADKVLIPYDKDAYMELRASGAFDPSLSNEKLYKDATSLITFN